MKTIKNIFLLIIILGVLYILALFLATDLVRPLGNTLGLKDVNNFLLQSKGALDSAATNISLENLQKTYNETIDTAIDAKNQLEDGVNTTKETIDGIRSGINDTRETVENGIETVNKTKEQIEETAKNLQEGVKKAQDLTDTVNNLTN